MMSNFVRSRISSFFEERKIKKINTLRRKLAQATTPVEIEKLTQSINNLEHYYQYDICMSDFANRMTAQLTFGTHISKGIHPDSRGNNVKFQATFIYNEYVGSHCLETLALDANGDASALPLVALFDYIVDDENELTLRELLLADDPRLVGCFADDLELSEQYKKRFQDVLTGGSRELATYELNKQLFWVNSVSSIENDDYICLIPLYPSALTHTFYQKIVRTRYSERNKNASTNRYKKVAEQERYRSMNGLAIVSLGGSNSQNVSQLNSSQKGRHYLLPSLPPRCKTHKIMPLNLLSNTIFNNDLVYICQEDLDKLYRVVESPKNVYTVRDNRSKALNMILESILDVVSELQKQPAGWSKDYQLEMCEKYWLDPKRAHLPDEEAFRAEYEKGEWVAEVERRFALWLNKCLQKRFPHIAKDFDDAEYHEWRRNIRRTLRYRLRHP